MSPTIAFEQELFYGAGETLIGAALYVVFRLIVNRFFPLRGAILVAFLVALPLALCVPLLAQLYFWWAPGIGVLLGLLADSLRLPAVK